MLTLEMTATSTSRSRYALRQAFTTLQHLSMKRATIDVRHFCAAHGRRLLDPRRSFNTHQISVELYVGNVHLVHTSKVPRMYV